MPGEVRVTVHPDGSETWVGEPEDVARALRERRKLASPGISRVIELATQAKPFHVSEAIQALTGRLIPPRIAGEQNSEYQAAYKEVRAILATYSEPHGYDVLVWREGRHTFLQLQPKQLTQNDDGKHPWYRNGEDGG